MPTKRRSWSRALAIVAAAVLSLAPSSAHAQDADTPDDLARGVQLRREGHDDAALEVFQRVWERSHAARALAQMGFAEQALGRWSAAEEHLAEAATSDDRWIRRHRATLDAALATVRRHIGSLDVRGSPVGAAVSIDGRAVGTLPLERPLRVAVGTVLLRVEAPGHRATERTVTIAAASLSRETLELSPLRADVVEAPTPTTRAPSVSRATPAQVTAPSTSGPLRPLAWALAGTAVVALGGGLAAQLVRENDVAAYNDPACVRNGRTRASNCGRFLASADTAQTLAIVGFVAGGALAAASATLFLLAPRRYEATQARTHLACGPGPGDVGIACVTTF